MKYTLRRSIIAIAALLVIVAPAASAQDGGSGTATDSSETEVSSSPNASPTTSTDVRRKQAESKLRDQLEQLKTERQAAQATLIANKAELRQKLDDAKKKICENRQTQINHLMTVMDKRRQNAFDNISHISDAAQTFYTNKGLSVSGYNDLVAAVNAAKTAAQTAMQTQQAVPDFNCDGDHPRADVADFKEKRADSIDAMKAYRDAVKALIKAIKTAVNNETAGDA